MQHLEQSDVMRLPLAVRPKAPHHLRSPIYLENDGRLWVAIDVGGKLYRKEVSVK